MSTKIKELFSCKRTTYTICIIVLLAALLIAGITLAFFTSRDTVTNELEAQEYQISLLEPSWYSSGKSDAKLSEPGMTIAKDPYVLNNSDTEVYIRMQITITDENGEDITNSARGKAILSAIYFYSTSTDDEGTSYQLYEFGDDGVSSQNSAFYYYDDDDSDAVTDDEDSTVTYDYTGWFYYTGSNSAELAALAAGGNTENLFDYILIPVLKAEYDGIFDTDYNIIVTAQCVPTGMVEITSFGDDDENGDIIAGYFDDYQDTYNNANVTDEED
ncbi:MAG: SipW-dependent-type signal peptide-containing protein [Ruminococcus sp.]|nr:SipW-dependent-type signal peptide-containing protein [Ruminococcus sp.]